MSRNPRWNPMLNKTPKTEFGRGFATCILKFLEHQSQHKEWLDGTLAKVLAKMPTSYPGGKRDAESQGVEMWFNGASDHYYELEIPDRWKGEEFSKVSAEVATKSLSIGHGFMDGGKWSMKDYEWCIRNSEKVLKAVDRKLQQTLLYPLSQIIRPGVMDDHYHENAREWVDEIELADNRGKLPRLVEDLSELVNLDSEPMLINDKVFEIAIAFDKRMGVRNADLGQY